MSDNAESIPHCPTPGKDPPATTSTSSDHPPSSAQTQHTIPESEEAADTVTKEKDTTSMPPPPRRNPSSQPRPKPQIITTQPSFSASRPSLTSSRFRPPSAGHSYTLTQTQTQSQTESQLPEIPRPPFAPFFTLINDSEKQGHTIHPHKIHYIFADDDVSDLLTSSLITSLHPASAASSPEASRELSSSQRESSSSSSATFKKKDKKDKKEKKQREERIVIVDVDAQGTGVKAVSSLSSTWQVLHAEISNAPTFEARAEGDEGQARERGLMLRIEGLGVSALAEEDTEKREGRGEQSVVMGDEEMSTLLEGFDRKMGVLRRIVSNREMGGDGAEEENVGIEGAAQGRRVSEEREFGSG